MPISAPGPIDGAGIDGHAGLAPRRRMHDRAGRNVRSRRTARTAAALRETACARPRRRPDRARATRNSATLAAHVFRNAARYRQAPARVCRQLIGVFGVVEKGEVARAGAVERRDTCRSRRSAAPTAALRRPSAQQSRSTDSGAGRVVNFGAVIAQAPRQGLDFKLRPRQAARQNLVPPPNRKNCVLS